jgi:predicted metal-dependent phosphoesterase TrpH
MTTLKIDFHVHTNDSDSISSVEKIIGAARQKRLDGIAITDHETTSAFAQATKLAPDLIIILGMEVETMEGHILILGVEDVPPKGLSAVEVAEYARQKGGVVIIPHPNIFFISIREDVIKRIRPDAIETYNAGIPFSGTTRRRI